MHYQEKRKTRSFKWVYLIIIVAFFIWIMSDELSGENPISTTIDVELPK